MIIIESGSKFSFFEENSKTAKILLSTINLKTFDKFIQKSFDENGTFNFLCKLSYIIQEKLEFEIDSSFKRISNIDFKGRKVALNLANLEHKLAFFLIKIYNLMESHSFKAEGDILIKKVNNSYIESLL